MKKFNWLLLLLLATGALAQNADSLLVKSIGGKEAVELIKRLESSYMTGRADFNGLPGTFVQIFSAPDKLYLELKFEQFTLKQGYNGKVAWTYDLNGSITELSGFEKMELLKSVYLESYSFVLPDRMDGSVEYMGQTELNGTAYHLVNLYPLNKDTLPLYLDLESAQRKVMSTNLDNLKAFVYIDQVDTVDGLIIPTISKTVAPEASIEILLETDSIELNKEIDHSIFEMVSEKPEDYFFPVGVDSILVPFEFRYGHIRVEVTVNDTTKAWFILDSGASSTILNSSLTAKLNLQVVGSIPAKGIGGYTDVDLVKTDSMAIASLTLYSQVTGSLDLSTFDHPKSGRFGGLLGYDFISRFPTMINYEKSLMVIYRPGTPVPSNGGIEIPFFLTMQVPTVRASVNGIEGDFIVDLGNAFGLILHSFYFNSSGLVESLKSISDSNQKVGGIGDLIPGSVAEIDSFKIGDIKLFDLSAIIPEQASGLSGSRSIAGNIGNLVLNKFRVLFDYGNSRLVFYTVDK